MLQLQILSAGCSCLRCANITVTVFKTSASLQAALSQCSTGSEFNQIDIGPDLQVTEPVIVPVGNRLWQSMTDMISNSDELFMLFLKAQKRLDNQCEGLE